MGFPAGVQSQAVAFEHGMPGGNRLGMQAAPGLVGSGSQLSPTRSSSADFLNHIHQVLQTNGFGMHVKKGQKNNLANLSLELLKGHVLECCLDKTCAKYIQEKLTSVLTRSERTCFLDELFAIEPSRFEHLVTDCFGNYIVQKALLLPNLEHKYQDAAFQQIKGRIFVLSTDKHGCRVI